MDCSDPLKHLDTILNDKPEYYTQNSTALINDFYDLLQKNNTPFASLHSSASAKGFVRGRLMIQSGGDAEFVNTFYKATKGDTSFNTTILLRDDFDADLEVDIVDADSVAARFCYTVIDVPGVSSWFIDEFEAMEVAQEKKMRHDNSEQRSLKYLAKFYGENGENLKPNTIVDVCGILHKYSEKSENGQEYILPCLHILKYEVVTPEILTNGFQLLKHDMICVREVLKKNLTSLLGNDSSANFVLANILSSTYARVNAAPLCSLPINIADLTDSGPIISFLKTVLPKVKVMQLTPELLSNVPFASVKDYEKDVLIQGELQLSNGTIVIIDETKLPDGSFAVSGYAEANLKSLEQLILEQRIYYDYNFYKIPFDVDYPLIILSKKTSKIFKTPYIVPFVSHNSKDEIPALEDLSGLCIARKYIQYVRHNLRRISITGETTQTVKEDFVEIAKKAPKDTNKADLLNEFLILSRILAASEGSDEVTVEHWRESVAIEKAREEAMRHFDSL